MKHELQMHSTEQQQERLRKRVQTLNTEPSLTQQHFKDDCDINNIINKYEKTGQLPLSNKVGRYADYSELTDYQGMLQTIQDAQDAFMELPALIRSKFRNNPGEMINFLQNPNNREEAIKLGLVNPQPNQSMATNDKQIQTNNDKSQSQQTPTSQPVLS